MNAICDHPEYRAQLVGIRAMPDDDVRRLVLADWLDEHGEPERAELIRVGVELARRPTHTVRRRELVLAETLFHQPLGRLALAGCSWEWDRGFLTVRGPLVLLIGGECRRCQGVRFPGEQYTTQPHPSEFRRARCQECDGTGRTAGVLPAVVRAGAVERVEVTDREPREGEAGGWWWVCEPASRLSMLRYAIPKSIWWGVAEGSPGRGVAIIYPSPAAAKSALSQALIRWAESDPMTS